MSEEKGRIKDKLKELITRLCDKIQELRPQIDNGLPPEPPTVEGLEQIAAELETLSQEEEVPGKLPFDKNTSEPAVDPLTTKEVPVG